MYKYHTCNFKLIFIQHVLTRPVHTLFKDGISLFNTIGKLFLARDEIHILFAKFVILIRFLKPFFSTIGYTILKCLWDNMKNQKIDNTYTSVIFYPYHPMKASLPKSLVCHLK